MSHNNPFTSPQEFLSKMELGLLDGKFSEEMRKLSSEQLEEAAHILMERSPRGRLKIQSSPLPVPPVRHDGPRQIEILADDLVF